MSYATLTEVKTAVGVDDALDDSQLTIALNATVDLIDRYCNRRFRTVDTNDDADKSTRTYTPMSPRLLFVDDVLAVDEVQERSTVTAPYETVDASDYELAPSNAAADGRPFGRVERITGSWPNTLRGVKVTGWFGWETTPEAVKQATILQASRLARRREAPLGISQVPSFDGNTGMRILSKLDADVEVLLAGYRRDPVLVG